MNRHRVGHLEEFPTGTMKAVRLNGRDLVLIRKGQRVFALRDICPHQGAALSRGILDGTTTSGEVGEYCLEKNSQIVRCPWHNWEFDAADGTCLHDPSVRVAAYTTEIENDEVFIVT